MEAIEVPVAVLAVSGVPLPNQYVTAVLNSTCKPKKQHKKEEKEYTSQLY